MVNPSSPPAPQRSVRQEIIETLFYVRARLSPGTNKTLESLSFLNSQIELLEERSACCLSDFGREPRGKRRGRYGISSVRKLPNLACRSS